MQLKKYVGLDVYSITILGVTIDYLHYVGTDKHRPDKIRIS